MQLIFFFFFSLAYVENPEEVECPQIQLYHDKRGSQSDIQQETTDEPDATSENITESTSGWETDVDKGKSVARLNTGPFDLLFE